MRVCVYDWKQPLPPMFWQTGDSAMTLIVPILIHLKVQTLFDKTIALFYIIPVVEFYFSRQI